MKRKLSIFMMVLAVVSLMTMGSWAATVLYEDNFSSFDPGWGSPDDRQMVKDGKFIIKAEVGKSWTALNMANVFENMDASVKVCMAQSEETNWGAGLVFWAKDYNEYYYVVINADGWYAVYRWINNRSLRPVDWRESSAIKKGVGQWNVLGVTTKGNEASIYINNTKVISIKGQPPQGGGLIGLRGSSGERSLITWEFSDLKVTQP